MYKSSLQLISYTEQPRVEALLQPELELDNLNVGVEQDVIAFDITGTIRDIDDDLLAELANETL